MMLTLDQLQSVSSTNRTPKNNQVGRFVKRFCLFFAKDTTSCRQQNIAALPNSMALKVYIP
jgi:hypothetical protein